ncbi:MAG: alpha/beta hydrolase [Atopostipes sp.]|nr:alpha/beta hydrolase [Atopostipes sp.]
MEFIYQEKEKGAPVFVLLHGTGGNEKDLLPLAEELNPEYNQLGIRGAVNENGMNRFFKRHAEGKYDWEDLEYRGKELYHFIKERAQKEGFALEDVVLVGFSNGSNIAIKMMLQQPEAFKKALLFSPMYPKEVTNTQDLSNTKVFLSLGVDDPIVSEAESQRVIRIFEDRDAELTAVWGQGHRLDPRIVKEAKDWLKE